MPVNSVELHPTTDCPLSVPPANAWHRPGRRREPGLAHRPRLDAARFGVGTVVRTTRALEARRLIERRHFDIVVCEYHFEDQPMTGQDLLDDCAKRSYYRYRRWW